MLAAFPAEGGWATPFLGFLGAAAGSCSRGSLVHQESQKAVGGLLFNGGRPSLEFRRFVFP